MRFKKTSFTKQGRDIYGKRNWDIVPACKTPYVIGSMVISEKCHRQKYPKIIMNILKTGGIRVFI